MSNDNGIKDLEITFRVRNNRLKARRLRLGLSQAKLAVQAGMSQHQYCQLEAMRFGPCGIKGDWRKGVVKLAEILNASLDDLFPPRVLAINQPTTQIKHVDLDEINQLSRAHQELLLECPEDSDIERFEKREELEEMMKHLSSKEQSILRRYYGLTGEDVTLAEVGEEYQVLRERIRQIIAKALRKIRQAHHQATLRGSGKSTSTIQLIAELFRRGITYAGPDLTRRQVDCLMQWLRAQRGFQRGWKQPPLGQFIPPAIGQSARLVVPLEEEQADEQ
jgi:RNA polymerase sigma factor (sigma-70 family)